MPLNGGRLFSIDELATKTGQILAKNIVLVKRSGTLLMR